MLHVQLRRYLPDAVTRAEVLDVQEIQFSKAGSATAALTLKVSLAMSEGIRDWIEDHPGQAFIVGIEYAVDGGPWFAPRDNLFVAYKGTADDVDPAEVQQITCMDWVSWQLARTYLHWATGAANNEREWTESGFPASAGTIIGGMIFESKNRGWGPAFQTDFAWNIDSAGAAWTAAEKVKQKWKLLTPLSQVLQSITEQGLCDWWSEGTKLRLFRPGVGEDRTNVVLGGAGFSRAPGAWDFSNVLTNLTVVPEAADMWLYLPNPGADTTFGRLEATMTQSGVADHATATTLAQPTLSAGRAAKREQSYEWIVADGMPVPWVDFNVHDITTIDTAFGAREERVVELVVRVRDDVVTCVAVTGDKMLSAVARKDRRAQSAVIGNVVGGSGNGIPGSGGPTLAGPVAPTGLHVDTNVGSWRADGTAQARVALSWDAVTQTTDGSSVSIRGYEVASRTATSEPVIVSTTGVSFTATEWEPGVVRYVKVRALPQSGSPSPWSTEIAVTPQVPGLIIPKVPTGLAVSSNTAAFQADGSALATVTVTWSAVTQSLDNSPLTVKEYEVKVGLDAQRVTGTTATFTVPSSRGVTVTVRALSTLDVWGDPTTGLSVTGAAPTTTMPIPSAPILTAGMGGVAFRWDGLSSTAGAMPAGFNRVVVDVGPSATGPWTALGTPLSAAGGGSVSGPNGTAIHIRFRSFDTLGRVGGTSAVRNATPIGVPLGELDPAVQTAITDALNGVKGLAARGNDLITNGNAVLGSQNFSAFTLEVGDQPTGTAGAFTAGTAVNQVRSPDELIPIDPAKPLLPSMWVKQVNAGVVSRCYFGLAPYDVDGLAISPVNYMEQANTRTTLAAALVAGQTTVQLTSAANWHNGATASLRYVSLWNYIDGKGKAWPAGTYSRNVRAYDQGAISGNTVTLPTAWAGATVPAGTAVSNGATGGTYMYAPGISNALVTGTWVKLTATAPFFGVHPGGPLAASTAFPISTTQVKVVILSNYSVTGGTSKQLFAGLSLSESAAVLKTADGKNRIFPSVTEPTATAPGDLWWMIDAAGVSILGVKMWDGTAWKPYLIVADQVIATGSITSPLIGANAIQVDHLAPNVGQSIDISANASVNIIVGKQAQQDGQIDALGDEVSTAQTAAEAAQSTAVGAQAAADTVSGRLDQHQLYFKVEVDSVKIGRPDGSSELRLAPEGIQMMQQGVAVSRWEGGVFIADETRLKASSIASHRFEGFGPGRTIVRPL